MLLDQIDELTARIGTVTELLDAAIATLSAEPATGPAGPLASPPATDAAVPARFAATVEPLAKISLFLTGRVDLGRRKIGAGSRG